MTIIASLWIVAGLLGVVAPSSGTDDVMRGAGIYRDHCAACHDNSAHMLNDIGPALFGVVGRRVGSVSGYDYSPALQRPGAMAIAGRPDISTASCAHRKPCILALACR